MTTLLLEEKGRSQVTQHTLDDKAGRELRRARETFLEYFRSIGRSIGEPQDTSPQGKTKESFATWFLVYVPPERSFREQVVYPITSLWEPSLDVSSYLEPAEEEEEEYEFLHDYVLDDLSVDYHSAKNFHEYLMSLRRQYEHGKQPTK